MPTATAALAAASAPTGFPSAIQRRCAAWRSLNTSSHLAEAARSSPRAADRSGWHFASARLYADSTFAADAWDAAAGLSGGNSYSPSVASVASRHPAEASACAPERSKSRCASARASSSADARCSLSSMTRRCEATRSVMSRALFACFFAARASSLWRSVSAERCASEASRARRRVGDSGSGAGAGGSGADSGSGSGSGPEESAAESASSLEKAGNSAEVSTGGVGGATGADADADADAAAAAASSSSSSSGGGT